MTVPDPAGVWQDPSPRRKVELLQVPDQRLITSALAAFVIEVAPENFAILPLAGVPVVVTVPDPAGVAHVPSPRQKVVELAPLPPLSTETGREVEKVIGTSPEVLVPYSTPVPAAAGSLSV